MKELLAALTAVAGLLSGACHLLNVDIVPAIVVMAHRVSL